jgi:hypothetical protein
MFSLKGYDKTIYQTGDREKLTNSVARGVDQEERRSDARER